MGTAFVPSDYGVSGDFYLVTNGPEGSTMAVVGDVVGHGPDAARLATSSVPASPPSSPTAAIPPRFSPWRTWRWSTSPRDGPELVSAVCFRLDTAGGANSPGRSPATPRHFDCPSWRNWPVGRTFLLGAEPRPGLKRAHLTRGRGGRRRLYRRRNRCPPKRRAARPRGLRRLIKPLVLMPASGARAPRRGRDPGWTDEPLRDDLCLLVMRPKPNDADSKRLMIEVDTESFFVIVLVAALAAVTVALLRRPGWRRRWSCSSCSSASSSAPRCWAWQTDEFIQFFSNLGLGSAVLLRRLRDRLRADPGQAAAARGPRLAALGRLAYAIGGVLAAAGVVDSFLYTGSAMATTAIGTLIPILRDTGELRTRFGTYLLAAGGGRGVRADPAGDALPLDRPSAPRGGDPDRLRGPGGRGRAGLGGLAWRGWPALERTFESSSQLAVRVTVVLVFGLVLLASELGLDVLLGGFVAGMITRAALRGTSWRSSSRS